MSGTARVRARELRHTETTLIIPGYAVNWNNFPFDALWLRPVSPPPSRLCQGVR